MSCDNMLVCNDGAVLWTSTGSVSRRTPIEVVFGTTPALGCVAGGGGGAGAVINECGDAAAAFDCVEELHVVVSGEHVSTVQDVHRQLAPISIARAFGPGGNDRLPVCEQHHAAQCVNSFVRMQAPYDDGHVTASRHQ